MKTLLISRRKTAVLALAGFVAVAFVPSRRGHEPPPLTLEEVARRGREVGLHSCAEGGKGPFVQKLVLSETPLTEQEVRSLSFANLDTPAWSGKVCVIRDLKSLVKMASPPAQASCGQLAFYGDRRLARQLAEQFQQ